MRSVAVLVLVCACSATPHESDPECTPAGCDSACGDIPDGCGGIASCGDCGDGETCGVDAPNTCGVGTCTPETDASLCARYGHECDPFSAGDNCGTCSTGTCNAGQCSCTDECTAGAAECTNGAVRVCDNTGGCAHWTTPTACPSGTCGSPTTCAAPATGYVHLTAGFRHTCGLHGDGTIACWGDNSQGQSNAPAGTFTKISAGDFHTCAITTAGALTCWGAVAPGTSAGPYLDVDANVVSTCAIKADHSVLCEGNQIFGTPTTGAYTQVATGASHACALKQDGTIACWGNSSDGKLAAPSGAFVAIDAGDNHTCARRADGTIACWGSNISYTTLVNQSVAP